MEKIKLLLVENNRILKERIISILTSQKKHRNNFRTGCQQQNKPEN